MTSASYNNQILNWTWEKPTVSGMYLACYGDVEVMHNIKFIYLDDQLMDQDGENISVWSGEWKFARLAVGSEAKALAEANSQSSLSSITE